MGLDTTAAVVIGGFPLGESDRVVAFFTRAHGKLRGVARAARRVRSRFVGAFELGTLGQLVFFDTGRSELVRVDHFDVLRPFARVREDLERLAQAAWIAECVGRLTAEHDPNRAVWALLVRALDSLDAGAPPRRVAVAFGVRSLDALGHRLRTEGCTRCGRPGVSGAAVTVDVQAGGVLCRGCPPGADTSLTLAGSSVAALRRLRTLSWEAAVGGPLPVGAEPELRALLELQVAWLSGQPSRAARFIREVERWRPSGGAATTEREVGR
jgi:DNA repair protein RecO (recombination protein O)